MWFKHSQVVVAMLPSAKGLQYGIKGTSRMPIEVYELGRVRRWVQHEQQATHSQRSVGRACEMH